MLNFSPTGAHILVKVERPPEKTAGGIILIEQTREVEQMASTKGRVISVGTEAWDEFASPWANCGDTVLFAKYAGLKVPDADPDDSESEYRVMNDTDVLGIYKS